jgi:hypothetical protein
MVAARADSDQSRGYGFDNFFKRTCNAGASRAHQQQLLRPQAVKNQTTTGMMGVEVMGTTTTVLHAGRSTENQILPILSTSCSSCSVDFLHAVRGAVHVSCAMQPGVV